MVAERAETLAAAINTATVPGIEAFTSLLSPTDLSPAAVVAAWRLAYTRDPTPSELAAIASFASEQLTTLRADPSKLVEGRSPPQQVLINICQVLLSSNEFLTIE